LDAVRLIPLSDVTNIRAKHTDDETTFIHNALMIRNLLDGNVVLFAGMRTLPNLPGNRPAVLSRYLAACKKECIDFGHLPQPTPWGISQRKQRSGSNSLPPLVSSNTWQSLVWQCCFAPPSFRDYAISPPRTRLTPCFRPIHRPGTRGMDCIQASYIGLTPAGCHPSIPSLFPLLRGWIPLFFSALVIDKNLER